MSTAIDRYLADKVEANMDFSVLRLHRFREALGLEDQFPPMVLVGGTNGKGSTVAFLASILQAHDVNVGTFTSPHLHAVQERITLNQQAIDLDAWTVSGQAIVDAMTRTAIELTYFETLTFLAYHYFCQTQPDICLFEVGMGGRLDATNCLPHQRSIITRIDLDHMEYLGSTLGHIAREKAHIMTPQGLNILAAQAPSAASWLADHGGTSLQKIWEDKDFQHVSDSNAFTFQSSKAVVPRTKLGLHGPAQATNASLAVACSVDILKDAWQADRVQQGLQHARHAGRMETWVLQDQTYLLDAAHNPSSIEHLVRYIRRHRPIKKYPTYVGCSQSKDVAGIFETIAPLADPLITVGFDHPRAWRETPQQPLTHQRLDEALADAQDKAHAEMLWTGSIFFVAQLRAMLMSAGARQKDSFFS
jgi:dihydrofolate synthase/folylpolyglutamate synthase